MLNGRIKKTIVSISLFLLILTIAFFLGVHFESKSLNFGSTNDPFLNKRLKNDCCRNVNKEGLSELNAYGSGLVKYYGNFKNYYKDNIQSVNGKLYIVSLLPNDIYYYNDRCLRWYGVGYFNSNLGDPIIHREIMKSAYKKLIRLVYGNPPTYDLSQLRTEQEITKELGIEYLMPLKGSGEWLNNDQFIEDTIRFFESLPNNSHLYVHCAHGRGRTTSYLVLYDIFKNAKKIPLKDIADRHYCLGREDVLNTDVWVKGTWTQEALDARKDLMVRFYDFMTDTKGYGHQSWTQWNIENGAKNNPQIAVHRKEEKKTELVAVE